MKARYSERIHAKGRVIIAVGNGSHFGVEFIKMGERDQRKLHRFIAQDRSDQAVKKKGTRRQFSDPGGQNWHLEGYSLARRETGSVP